MWWSRHPILEFWDPPNISQTVEARNFKFGTETVAESFNEKMQKWVKRNHLEVTSPNSGILGPPNISRTVEAGNFKFGTETESGEL